MNEQQWAEMESAMNSKEDAYFAARPQIDTEENRTLWRAGFERGYRTERLPEEEKTVKPLALPTRTTSG